MPNAEMLQVGGMLAGGIAVQGLSGHLLIAKHCQKMKAALPFHTCNVLLQPTRHPLISGHLAIDICHDLSAAACC